MSNLVETDCTVLSENQRYEIHRDGWVRLRNSRRQPITGTVRNDGAVQVSLALTPGKSKTYLLHKLVAEHFVAGREITRKEVVVHKDGDQLNCSADNLMVMPMGEYMRERYADGRSARRRGRL